MTHELTITKNANDRALPHALYTASCPCQWQAHAATAEQAQYLYSYHVGRQGQIHHANGILMGHN